MIEGAAGRCDDDVDAALQGAQLRVHRGAAVDRQDAHADALAVAVHGFGELHGELARRDEDEGDGVSALRGIVGDRVKNGQSEGGGLAGAGCGLRQDVAALEERRDGLLLDGRGLLVAEGRQRREQARVEGE